MKFSTMIAVGGLAFVMLLVMMSETAQADRNIRRSCTALYGIEIRDVADMEMAAEAEAPEPRWFAEFEGSAGCRKINPNKCRRNAQDAIFRCAETHWKTRAMGTTPRVCGGESVSGYSITDLPAAAREATCASPGLGTETVTVALHVTSLGSMGCGGGRALGGGMSPIGPLPKVNRSAEDQATRELGVLTIECGDEPTADTVPAALPNAALLGSVLRGTESDADGTAACKARLKMGEAGLAWDYSGGTWTEANAERLCAGSANPQQPVKCFDAVMNTGIDWGGGTRWNPVNALDLCAGSEDARATIECFQEGIAAGQTWGEAIRQCRE